MKKSEFLLMDLRNVLMDDCTEILDALKMFEWSEENAEARKALLAYVDKLHSRWDDLYKLEWKK